MPLFEMVGNDIEGQDTSRKIRVQNASRFSGVRAGCGFVAQVPHQEHHALERLAGLDKAGPKRSFMPFQIQDIE
jgi:hypothetical protein